MASGTRRRYASRSSSTAVLVAGLVSLTACTPTAGGDHRATHAGSARPLGTGDIAVKVVATSYRLHGTAERYEHAELRSTTTEVGVVNPASKVADVTFTTRASARLTTYRVIQKSGRILISHVTTAGTFVEWTELRPENAGAVDFLLSSLPGSSSWVEALAHLKVVGVRGAATTDGVPTRHLRGTASLPAGPGLAQPTKVTEDLWVDASDHLRDMTVHALSSDDTEVVFHFRLSNFGIRFDVNRLPPGASS
jgi:hypothetical protein